SSVKRCGEVSQGVTTSRSRRPRSAIVFQSFFVSNTTPRALFGGYLPMTSLKSIAVAGLAALAAACSSDASKVFTADNGPIAYVRFVNAVPDSGAGDWRFIDQVEGSPTAFGLAFRSMFPGSGYQLAAAGSRHLRVFQTSPDIQQTQVVWFDTTFTLQAGTHYTLLAAGNLRDKTAKMYILTDDFTDPGSQVALRVINTGAGVVDVYASPTGGTSTLPTPFAAAVANFTATKWVLLGSGGGTARGVRDRATRV